MTMANGKRVIIESPDGEILDTSLIAEDEELDVSQLSSIIGVKEFGGAIHIIISDSSALKDLLKKLAINKVSPDERHY